MIKRTASRTDTSIAISGERREKINGAIVEIVNVKRESVRMSEIVHYLIDNYLDEAVEQIKRELKKQ